MEIYKIDNLASLLAIWQDVRHYLTNALMQYDWHDRYPVDFVLINLIHKKLILWCVVKDQKIIGTFVTEEIVYPMGLALHIFLLAGDSFEEWADLAQNCLKKRAKEINARWIDAIARKGFYKHCLKDMGYKDTQQHFAFEVEQ